MKTSSKNAGASTASNSLLDISETALEPSEDPRLRAIETLETRMFRGFGEIEGELDDWERRLVECVRRTIEEIRVENVESMEAVQLDLEVLRHKVSSQSSHESPGFIDQLNSAVCIDTSFDLDLPAFRKLITDHLKVTYRLPSATIKLQESDDPTNTANECLLFDTADTNAKTESADEQTLQKSVEIPTETSVSPHRKSRVSRGSRQKRKGMRPPFTLVTRVVVATLYAVSVGVYVHAALSTI
jgi:hypothetical protein